jgi:hypothetical protein
MEMEKKGKWQNILCRHKSTYGKLSFPPFEEIYALRGRQDSVSAVSGN